MPEAINEIPHINSFILNLHSTLIVVKYIYIGNQPGLPQRISAFFQYTFSLMSGNILPIMRYIPIRETRRSDRLFRLSETERKSRTPRTLTAPCALSGQMTKRRQLLRQRSERLKRKCPARSCQFTPRSPFYPCCPCRPYSSGISANASCPFRQDPSASSSSASAQTA